MKHLCMFIIGAKFVLGSIYTECVCHGSGTKVHKIRILAVLFMQMKQFRQYRVAIICKMDKTHNCYQISSRTSR